MSAPLRTALRGARHTTFPKTSNLASSASSVRFLTTLQPWVRARPKSHEGEARRLQKSQRRLSLDGGRDHHLGYPVRIWKDPDAEAEAYIPRVPSEGGDRDPDPNKAQLGSTLRILKERMPTLLQYPLPQHILSPNITLHLFPSTHPHLPTVTGRVAYTAALWSSPIAWNRVPIIGNVHLEILTVRMTSEPLTFLPRCLGTQSEQLVVRWTEKTKCNDDAGRDSLGVIGKSLRFGRDGVDKEKAFTGLFIFNFDKQGRILCHTIERAQASGDWDKGVGAKVVGLTDRLLGGIKDPGDTIPTFQELEKERRR